MAKDDFDLDLEGFDDSALDMPDFDSNLGEGDNVGSRTPATKFKKGFTESAHTYLTSRENYISAAEKALPPSYGRLKDKGMEVVDVFDRLKKDTTAQLKPEIKKIKRITQKLVPTAERFLPKSLTEKLKTFSDTGPSKEAFAQIGADELKLQTTLSDIFNKQQAQLAEEGAEQSAQKAYDEHQSNQRTQLIVQSQDSTKSLIARLVSYQDNITARYQKESLELQFRHFFVARDLFQISSASYKDIIIRLDEIKQNTGLPDIQKIQKSEAWKQGIMDEFFGKKGQSVAKILDSYWDSTKQNIYSSIKSKFDTAMEFVSMPLDAIEDMTSMMEGVDMGVSQEEMAGSMAGDYFSEWIVNKVFKPIGNYLRGNETIQKGARSADYILANLGSVITEYSNRDYNNPLLNKLAQGVRSVIPSEVEPGEEIGKRLRTTGLEPAFYDVATRRSIIEVIPGFLSRIHQGIMQIATGDKNYPRLEFDSTKEQFISIKEAAAALKEKLTGGDNQRRMQNALDYFYQEIDKDNILNDNEKKLISLQLMKKTAVANTGQFNPDALYEQDFYDQDIDPKLLDKMRTLLQGRYKRTKSGELDISNPELASITKKYLDLSYAHANVQDIINQAQAFGETDILRETGLLKYENEEEIFDKDKYRKDLLGLNDNKIKPIKNNVSLINKPISNTVSDSINQSNEEQKQFLYNLPILESIKINIDSIPSLVNNTNQANDYLNEIKQSNEELFYTLLEIKEDCLECDKSNKNKILNSIKINTDSIPSLIDTANDYLNEIKQSNEEQKQSFYNLPILESIKSSNEILNSIKINTEPMSSLIDTANDYLNEIKQSNEELFYTLLEIKEDCLECDKSNKNKIQESIYQSLINVNQSLTSMNSLSEDFYKQSIAGIADVGSVNSLIDSLVLTNTTLDQIKTFNELHYFDVDRLFKTEGYTDFDSVRELLEATAISVDEIDNSLKQIDLSTIKTSQFQSVVGLEDYSDPNKIRTFKQDVLELLSSVNKGVIASVEATIDSTKALLTGLGDIKIDDSITRLFKKSITSIGDITKLGLTGAFKGIGGFFGGIGQSLKIGAGLFKDDGIRDIYVTGDEEPRLLSRKLRKRNYIDTVTKKPVQFIDDIKNPVCDVSDNMAIVITKEDLKKGLYINAKEGALRTITRDVYSLGKSVFSGTGGVIKAMQSFYKKTKSFSLKIAREISGITDVYVVGETEPRLLAVVIRRGGYVSVTTGKPIFSLGDIDGPIADATGKILLAMEDLPHLYDVNGNKLDLSTLSERVLAFFVKTGKGVYEIAKNVVMTGYNVVKKTVMAPLKLAKELGLKGYEKSKAAVKRSVIYLAKKMGYDITRIGDKEEEAPLAEILANEQIKMLKRIYNLLNQRIPKLKKIREGSWQKQFAEDEKIEQANLEQEQIASKKSPAIKSIAGKLGTITGAGVAANQTSDQSPISNAASTAKDAISTVASTGGSALLTYFATKFALGGGASVAATTGTSALATGALGALAIPAIPWVAGAAAVAAIGYGAMRLWDRRPPSEIQELRMMQYGVLKNEYNRLAILREFEDRMSENTNIIDQIITIKKDSVSVLKENYELFDVDVHSRYKQKLWLNWYENRFLPIFKRHFAANLEGGIKNLDDIEDQNSISKLEYIKRVTPDKLKPIYLLFDSPFSDGDITVDPTQIIRLKNALLKKYDQEHKELLSNLQPPEKDKEKSHEKKTKDIDEEKEKSPTPVKSMFSSFSDKIVSFFQGPSLKADTRDIGLIEKYRLLQYGINPNDDYQVQPIRALEKYCFESMKFNYNLISKVTPYAVLIKVEKYFPIDKNNSSDANAWLYWYTDRFLPIYVKYLKFMEKQKIKDFFNLENLLQSAKLTTLIMAVNPSGTEIDPYEIISSPFGGYKLSVTIDLIYEFKKYLLNLKAPEKIDLKLGDFSSESIKVYQQQIMKTALHTQDVNKVAQSIVNKAPLSNVNRQFSPWRSMDENLISLMPPIDAQPNSLYGIRKDPITGEIKKHLGVDYAAPKDTPIRAAADGKIIKKYDSKSYGNVIFIEHNDGLVTKYAHMSKFNDAFGVGDLVKTGEVIGYVGNTGKSSGNHLHFELRKGPDQGALSYDPLQYMKVSDINQTPSESIFDTKATGGDETSLPDYGKKHPVIEDYTQIVSKETEQSIKRKSDALAAQKSFDQKIYIDKLDSINTTLLDQLKIQMDISDYLKSIKASIESINIPVIETIPQAPNPPTTQTVHYKLPTKQSVIPALSMKRRKYNE